MNLREICRRAFVGQKHTLVLLLVSLLLFSPSLGRADVAMSAGAQAALVERPPDSAMVSTPPSRGLGKRIAGWVLSGLGVVTAGASAICFADFYPRDAQDLCLYGQLSIGGIELGVGITFLILGYGEKGDYDDWKRSHLAIEHLSRLGVATAGQGAHITYRFDF